MASKVCNRFLWGNFLEISEWKNSFAISMWGEEQISLFDKKKKKMVMLMI